MQTRERAGLILMLFTMLMLTASTALACSCMPMTAEEAVERADAVFWGVVTDSDRPRPGKITSTFTAKKWFKGAKSKTVDVQTNSAGTACGVRFDVGESYLVFAYARKSGGYGTSSCSQTHVARVEPTSATKKTPPRDLSAQKKVLDPVLRPLAEKAAKVCGNGAQFQLTFYDNGEIDIDRESECWDDHFARQLKMPKLPTGYPFQVFVWLRSDEVSLRYEAGRAQLRRTKIRQMLDSHLPIVDREDRMLAFQSLAMREKIWHRAIGAACNLSGVGAARRYLKAQVGKRDYAQRVADDPGTLFYDCAVLRREWKLAEKLISNLEDYHRPRMVKRMRRLTRKHVAKGLPLAVSLDELELSAADVLRFARNSSVWTNDVVLLELVAKALLKRPGGASKYDRELAAMAYARAAVLYQPISAAHARRAIALGGERVVDEMEKRTDNSFWRKRARADIERLQKEGRVPPRPPK